MAEKETPLSTMPRTKRSLKSKLLWVCFILGSFALLRGSGLLFILGLLPALVMRYTDITENQYWFKTIFCFNLAGLFPYLIEMYFIHHNSFKALQLQLTDSMMWLFVYGMAAVGYALLWVCPIIAEFFYNMSSHASTKRHRDKLQKLHDEWGIGSPEMLD